MFTNYLEILAFIAGLLNIYLITKSSLWNWFFGIITVSLYMVIFFNVKLYADTCLQIVFLIFQFYGLYQWLYGGKQKKALTIQLANSTTYRSILIVFPLIFIPISFILKNYTDSTTIYADTLVTSISLLAQWMMSKKYSQHWILWILVDICSVILYLYKSLYLTALLYFMFLLLCIKGYIDWNFQRPIKISIDE